MEILSQVATALLILLGVISAGLAVSQKHRDLAIWVGFAAAVCGCLWFCSWLQDYLWKQDAEDLIKPLARPTIAPSVIKVGSGEWETITPVVVFNPNDVPVYAVMLRISGVAQSIAANSLVVIPDKLQPPVEMRMADVIASADGIRMNCTTTNGIEVVYCVLYSIQPRTSRRVAISAKNLQKAEIGMSVISFFDSPQSLLKKVEADGGEMVSVNFNPPAEANTLQAVIINLRRVE